MLSGKECAGGRMCFFKLPHCQFLTHGMSTPRVADTFNESWRTLKVYRLRWQAMLTLELNTQRGGSQICARDTLCKSIYVSFQELS